MSDLNGFVENMPFDEYAKVDALNGSSIVHMRRSPMRYRWEKDNPQPPTPALILGTATHRMILEPNRVGDFAVWGEVEDQKVRRGKVWDTFQAEHPDQMILTRDERDAMVGMAVAVRKNLPIRRYADAKGPTEISMFWVHPFTKRRYKARLDKLIPETHTIFDLKTARDCQSYRFGGQAYALGYHIKMAIQFMGFKELTGIEPKMRLGAIDSKAPHESAVYRLTTDVILQGLEELGFLVEKLDECEKTGLWPAEQNEETDLILPSWATADEYRDGEVA